MEGVFVKMTDFFPVMLFTSLEVMSSLVMDGNRHLTPASIQGSFQSVGKWPALRDILKELCVNAKYKK